MSKNSDTDGTAEVIPLRPSKEAMKASEKKWGKKVMQQGFCMVPSLLFRAQQRLGLSATQLAILMHLADYWWDADRKPWPSKATLAKRLNLSTRQVQRYMAELEAAGLVKRVQRRAAHGGIQSNLYDLSGLVAKLKELEPEFREVEEEVEANRRQVASRGGRRKRAKPAE